MADGTLQPGAAEEERIESPLSALRRLSPEVYRDSDDEQIARAFYADGNMASKGVSFGEYSSELGYHPTSMAFMRWRDDTFPEYGHVTDDDFVDSLKATSEDPVALGKYLKDVGYIEKPSRRRHPEGLVGRARERGTDEVEAEDPFGAMFGVPLAKAMPENMAEMSDEERAVLDNHSIMNLWEHFRIGAGGMAERLALNIRIANAAKELKSRAENPLDPHRQEMLNEWDFLTTKYTPEAAGKRLNEMLDESLRLDKELQELSGEDKSLMWAGYRTGSFSAGELMLPMAVGYFFGAVTKMATKSGTLSGLVGTGTTLSLFGILSYYQSYTNVLKKQRRKGVEFDPDQAGNIALGHAGIEVATELLPTMKAMDLMLGGWSGKIAKKVAKYFAAEALSEVAAEMLATAWDYTNELDAELEKALTRGEFWGLMGERAAVAAIAGVVGAGIQTGPIVGIGGVRDLLVKKLTTPAEGTPAEGTPAEDGPDDSGPDGPGAEKKAEEYDGPDEAEAEEKEEEFEISGPGGPDGGPTEALDLARERFQKADKALSLAEESGTPEEYKKAKNEWDAAEDDLLEIYADIAEAKEAAEAAPPEAAKPPKAAPKKKKAAKGVKKPKAPKGPKAAPEEMSEETRKEKRKERFEFEEAKRKEDIAAAAKKKSQGGANSD